MLQVIDFMFFTFFKSLRFEWEQKLTEIMARVSAISKSVKSRQEYVVQDWQDWCFIEFYTSATEVFQTAQL